MLEDKIEVDKAEAFTPVNESIVRQASEFLDSHGKSEMALMIRTLLDENNSWKKNNFLLRHLDSEVRYWSILIMIIWWFQFIQPSLQFSQQLYGQTF